MIGRGARVGGGCGSENTESRAANQREAGRCDEIGDGSEALGMSWGKDEESLGMLGEDLAKGLEEESLFAVDGAAADDDGRCGRVFFPQRLLEGLKKAAGGGVRGDVELEVAGDSDAGGRSADGDKAIAVGWRLAEEQGDAGEQRRE